jgi:tryptophan-rich sensory protein
VKNAYNWYSQLKKPKWAPPSWLFGPVWSVLYVLIFVSFGAVFYKVFNHELPAIILLPFALNLIFNFIFTPIQFGLKNNYLAAVDIILVLITLGWAMDIVYSYIHWVILINIPYLLWVCFASLLQLTVTYLNKNSQNV